jgi:hypothetical protein
MIFQRTTVLRYVLRESGVSGRLTSGRIEVDSSEGMKIVDTVGSLNAYISSTRLRSWVPPCHGKSSNGAILRRRILIASWAALNQRD